MTSRLRDSYLGSCALAGGVVGFLMAPAMVTIKYMTGWSIIPKPFWVEPAQQALSGLVPFATPPELWMAFGTAYTIALLLMLVSLIGLFGRARDTEGRIPTKGYWILLAGFCMVIPGDAIHSWTWSQDGLTIPTPGTNPLANTAYAVHMMGMNLVMLGSLIVGISALRGKFLAPWLAWLFVLIFPSAILASTTFLPTTPSGALWLFSIMMAACGYFITTGRTKRLLSPNQSSA